MQIAVCDDEKVFQNAIRKELEEYYGILEVEITMFLSGEALLQEVQKNPGEFQIIFLDIEMSGMDGIKTAEKIREWNPHVPILFLTSHTEMAMEGYVVNAFRFLAKPIQKENLWKALSDLDKRKQSDTRIELWDGQKAIVVSWTDIEYVQSDNVYIHVITNLDKYLIREKLSILEEKMPKQIFYKPHRSYLINFGYVQSFDGKKIIMKSGKEIPISRGSSPEFKSKMMKYINTTG